MEPRRPPPFTGQPTAPSTALTYYPYNDPYFLQPKIKKWIEASTHEDLHLYNWRESIRHQDKLELDEEYDMRAELSKLKDLWIRAGGTGVKGLKKK